LFKGGKGYARDIIFEDIILNQTNYPVYIDQHYMKTPEQVNIIKFWLNSSFSALIFLKLRFWPLKKKKL